MAVEIQKTEDISIIELEPLIKESKKQGIFLVQRLVDEWVAKINCFDRKGEVLLIAKDDHKLVGICGLNIDPYYRVPRLGRVRHLYVLSTKRRQGIGSQLIEKIIRQARQHFDVLNLRTNNAEANKFYLAPGFQQSYKRPECTHILYLK